MVTLHDFRAFNRSLPKFSTLLIKNKCHTTTVATQLEKNFGKSNCEFIGFDSFQGFGKVNKHDEHPFLKDENFSVNENKVLRNIKKCSKGQKMRIIKGFFDDTIKNKTTKDLNIDKSRVVLIDCDQKEPTRLALEFISHLSKKVPSFYLMILFGLKAAKKKVVKKAAKKVAKKTAKKKVAKKKAPARKKR